MDEYACFKIWDKIQEKQGDYALSGWSVYLVENSELIDWVNENSDIGFKLTPSILVHYCICAGDRFTDIVTYGEPKITVKKLK
ncbi:MAG: hypothetical protein LBM93_14855 [Oscillospiraceae bacterium]|jgi:hypothetical protein|nr:hypothetical protein [Oscillospiraceae bacterium]